MLVIEVNLEVNVLFLGFRGTSVKGVLLHQLRLLLKGFGRLDLDPTDNNIIMVLIIMFIIIII